MLIATFNSPKIRANSSLRKSPFFIDACEIIDARCCNIRTERN